MKAVEHSLIEQRAYEIWERTGRPEGLDKEHWAQAERELLEAAPASERKTGAAETRKTNRKKRASIQQSAVAGQAAGSGGKQTQPTHAEQ